MQKQKSTARKPPVHIPLSFDKAVEGLLGVKPKPRPKKDAGKKK